MKILVINAGSSSLKYQLIDMDGEKLIAKGICERIGIDGRISGSTTDGRWFKYEVTLENHTAAFLEVKKALTSGDCKVIDDLSDISAVGHRIVQGGSLFKESVLVDEDVIAGSESLCDLAPLHNAAHIQGIRACREVFGEDVPEVVVFDNAFHSTMPPEAFLFPLPYEYYEKYKVRRYGFHGTSHRFVSARCAEVMGVDLKDIKLGGVDPSAITYLQEKEGWTPAETAEILNKKSGVLGISGISSDDRDVLAAAEAGNERAALARSIQRYQIRKFIGAYVAAMDGVDAIVFTGGIGENTCDLREDVCNHLTYLGVKIDSEKNLELRKGKEASFRLRIQRSASLFCPPTRSCL